ncbi:glycosyltransferase family 4 protein [Aerococcus urinaeequi]|uniref:glycosyltransferase family 4 protein n=1 Tax=Aerococcus urinaeequi TaxID=51665 RepID=UPI003D6AB8A1
MKVLILANSGIGLYKFRKELLLKLIAEGHQVYISIPDESFVKEFENIGCLLKRIPMERRGTNPFKDLKLLFSYMQLIKEISPGIIFSYTIKPNIFGGISARILNIPIIPNITGLGTTFSENSNKLIKLILEKLYKISLKKAQKIFFQNESNKAIFDKINISNSPKGILPGSGVNTKDFYYREYKRNDKIYFIYFGRIMKEKGINELLEAAKIISTYYKNVQFEIVGIPEDSNMMKKVLEYEKAGFIINHGYQPDITTYLDKASAVIQPSYSEGMSNVLLEASSSGRPVIASNIPGCKEIVEDTITGFLFEPKEVDELVIAIEKFIKLPLNDRIEMGRKARKKVENEFSRTIIVEEYMKELEKI